MWNAARLTIALAAALAAVGSVSAQTWVPKTGTIQTVYLSQAGNSAFRIFLSSGGANQLGDCSYNFAYMNTSDDNYQAKTAALLTAAASKKVVTIYYVKEANNWCKLVDFSVDFS